MISNCFLTFCALTSTLFTLSNAGATSMSCIWINNEKKCTQQSDPNGNMAGAVAGVNGGGGFVGAGAGTPDNFNPNYDQIGNGGENEGNEYPNPGTNGGSFSGASAGGGYPGYPPNFPQFNGNPFQFVHDFFHGK